MTLCCLIVQDVQSALPAQHFPHDALRLGLRTLKDEATVVHPLQAVQDNVSSFPFSNVLGYVAIERL